MIYWKQMKRVLRDKIVFSLIVICSGILLLDIQSGSASWSEPGATPPEGNIEAPLNTSAMGQSKRGGLFLGSASPAIGLMVNATSMAVFGGPVGVGSIDPNVYRNAQALFPGRLAGGFDIIW